MLCGDTIEMITHTHRHTHNAVTQERVSRAERGQHELLPLHFLVHAALVVEQAASGTAKGLRMIKPPSK